MSSIQLPSHTSPDLSIYFLIHSQTTCPKPYPKPYLRPLYPKRKTASPHWRRPFEEPKIRAQFTRKRLQCAALRRPRFRDSGQATRSRESSTRTREFGERQTLIGFLPEATHLRGPARRFHLLSIGAQGPENLSVPAGRAGLLHQRHIGKLRKVTDENRPLGPKRQVVCTYCTPSPSLPAAPENNLGRLLAQPSPRSYNCCRSSRL